MDSKRSRCMRSRGSTSARDSKGFFPEEERAHEKLFQLGNDLKCMLSDIVSDQAAKREELMKLKKENKRLKEKVLKMENGPEVYHNKTALETKLDAFGYELKKKDVALAALRNELKSKDVVLAALKEALKRKDELLQKDRNADAAAADGNDDDVQEFMEDRHIAEYDADVQEWMKHRNAYHDAGVHEWMKHRNADDDDGVQEWMKRRNADDDDDDDDVQEWMKEGNADGEDDDAEVQEWMKGGNANDDDDDYVQQLLKEGNADDDDDDDDDGEDDDDDVMKDRYADDVLEVMKEGNADEDDAQEAKKEFIGPSAKIIRAAFKEELKQILFKKSMPEKWQQLSLDDPQWQPFKTVPVEGTDEREEILDLDNGRIAMLRLQLGDEADSILLAAFDAAKDNHGQHLKRKRECY